MTDLFEARDSVDEFVELMHDPAARQAFVELKAENAQNGAKTRYQHVLKLVSETPWAIRPAMLAVIVDILAFRAGGGKFTGEEIEARLEGARRKPSQDGPQGVAVLPIQGVLVPKASMMSDISGGTSVESIRGMFRDAMRASDVSGIILDIDSPGGVIDGIPELASEIRGARGTKPIVAMANTEAASAAYWLASQADEIVVSKSSRVGSIGVFTAHEDQSQHDEMEGLKTTLISAGKHKTDGNPFEPLSDEARVHLQSMVDEFYGMFVGDVAKGRKVSVESVRGGFGEGRMVSAKAAITEGMADRMGTLESVVGELLSKRPAMQGNTTTTSTWGYSIPNPTVSITHLPNTGAGTVNVNEWFAKDPEPVPEPEPQPASEPYPGAAEQDALEAVLRTYLPK